MEETLKVQREEEYSNFRFNIRMLRTQLGLSAPKACAQIGLHHHKRLQDLEDGRGNPRMGEVIQISQYFGVKIDDLIYKKAIIHFI